MSASAAAEMKAMEQDPMDEFFMILQLLLEQIIQVFPECEKTLNWTSRIRVLVENTKPEKTSLMRNWYDGMLSCIEDCLNKNPRSMLKADVVVLKGIDFAKKWADPDLDEESRAALFEYINKLNYLATLQFEMQTENLPQLVEAAESLKKQVGLNIDQETGEVKFNIQALQETLSGGSSQLTEIMSAMQGLMPMIQNVMGGMAGDDDGSKSGMQQYVQANMKKMGTVFPPPQLPKRA